MYFTTANIKDIIKRTLSAQFDVDSTLTKIDRKIYRNFSKEEIGCRHCGLIYVSKLAMDRLQLARNILDRPIYVNSACRCEEHNAEVGGKANSYHIADVKKKIVSRAFDIKFVDGSELLELIIIFWLVGFRRFGINWKEKFLHIDSGKRGTGKFGYLFTY